MWLIDAIVERLLIFLTRICTGILVYGAPPQTGARVYFANHASHLDLMVILSAFPQRLRGRLHPVAARDYWEKTWLRRYLARRVLHCVFLDRRNAVQASQALRQLARMLREGESILIFPEGTRGDGTQIGRFHAGLHHLLRQAPEVPLTPVYLGGLSRTLPKGEFVPAPNMSTIQFGEDLHWQEGESKEDFLARCRESLLQMKEQTNEMAVE